MRPAYDLSDPDDASRFLTDHSERARYYPPGHQHITVSQLTNIADLAEPYRTDWSGTRERVSGDEALAALTLLADLRTWLTEIEPRLLQAARDAGVTWEELASVLGVGDRRAAQRRAARLLAASKLASAPNADENPS